MSVQRHQEHPADGVDPATGRPAWAWGALPPPPPPEPKPAAAPPPAATAPPPPAAPTPPPAPQPRAPWSWARGTQPPYVGAAAPERPGLARRALVHARGGAAGVTPVDRTALRVERVMVMAVLAAGWALALSSPRFGLALPLVAAALLAASAHPALSLPRLISARLLPATRLAGPWLTTEDPAPHRISQAVTGLVLVLASLCAVVGAPVAAWTLGWAVIGVTLVEFTFDVSLGALVHGRLRRAGLLRI